MRSVSLNEMKKKLGVYWRELTGKDSNNEENGKEVKRALQELNNIELEDGIFEIWLELFSETLNNESCSGVVKQQIAGFLSKEVKWWRWINKEEDRLGLFKKFVVNLFKSKKEFGWFVWRFAIGSFDVVFNQYKEIDNFTDNDCEESKLKDSDGEFINFENVSYRLADKTFKNFKRFNNFVDRNVLYELDKELDKSKEQFIPLPKEYKQYVIRLLKKLSEYNDSSTIYYGYREKAKITKSFFIDNSSTKESKKFIKLDIKEAIDNFVIARLLECNKSALKLLEFNTKTIKFIFKILYSCHKEDKRKFADSFEKFIKELDLIHSANYKIILSNLFILVNKFPVLENCFVDFIIKFLINLDSELTVLRKNSQKISKIDFTLRITFTHLNMKLKGKKNLKNKDLFINYFIKNKKKKKEEIQVEKIFDKILDNFFSKIITLEKTVMIQYLVIFVVNSKLKPLDENFDNFKQIFLHKMINYLFNPKVSSKNKENIITYLLSFLKNVEVDQKSIYLILYYCCQLLNKLTRRMIKKLKNEFPKIKNLQNFQKKIKERQRIYFLSFYNKGLFCKLFVFLANVMFNSKDDLESKSFIDLVNLFEAYFHKHNSHLEILINNNQQFHNTCLKLNKTIKNPLLKTIIDSSVFAHKQEKNLGDLSACKNIDNFHSPLRKKIIDNSSIHKKLFPVKFNCNMNLTSPSPLGNSLYTSNSLPSIISVNEQRRREDGVWDFEFTENPFKQNEAFFYREFICDRIPSKRKISVNDTDHSLLMTPVLEKRGCFDGNHIGGF